MHGNCRAILQITICLDVEGWATGKMHTGCEMYLLLQQLLELTVLSVHKLDWLWKYEQLKKNWFY